MGDSFQYFGGVQDTPNVQQPPAGEATTKIAATQPTNPIPPCPKKGKKEMFHKSHRTLLEDELKRKLLLHGAPAAGAAAAAPRPADNRERFVRAYDRLKDELLHDGSCELTDEARQWVAEMLDYNVPGGKLNRGLSVIDSYLLLKDENAVSEDEFFLACVLGWCVEWFQACALLLDDITDGAHTRRDRICWYRKPEVGLRGINDGILLKCHIQVMIKKYFREKPYFVDLVELWNEIGLQTSLGQMLDLTGTHIGAEDLTRYKMQGYRRIVKYKTSYYSFYLPVACALLMAGAKLGHFSELRDILLEMGVYFQIQDDYLDCFADPSVIGKVGTDIEDYKCSWLIVQALDHTNNNQMKVLYNNYGKMDSTCVAKVKSTYTALDLKDIFSEYEHRGYKHLISSIEAQQDRAVREILKSFLKKIHRRKK